MGEWGAATGAPGSGAAGSVRVRAEASPPLAASRLASDARALTATRDLQTLLSHAVQRLQAATGCAATAWALREDGAPYVAAAIFEANAPQAPEAAEFARLCALGGATDLTDRRIEPELQQLAQHHACHAVVPVRGSAGPALALLLLHAAANPLLRRPPRGGALPPRWLGDLDAASAELASPLAAALAVGRLRHLDHETRHLDRLAALGSLSAELSHELRNPLVAVKTFLQLLPERRHDPAFIDEFCEVARQELERMQRLLDTTLELAHPGPSRPDAGSARAAVEVAAVGRLLSHHAARRGVRLQAEVPGELPPLGLPADALRQVLLNLVQNAVDATAEGGLVTVIARPGRAGEVELEVRDQGPGIPAELAERVFEPFFTTREGGVGGLGLAISRRIVEEAGGRVELESWPGAGTAIRLLLPCSRPHGES